MLLLVVCVDDTLSLVVRSNEVVLVVDADAALPSEESGMMLGAISSEVPTLVDSTVEMTVDSRPVPLDLKASTVVDTILEVLEAMTLDSVSLVVELHGTARGQRFRTRIEGRSSDRLDIRLGTAGSIRGLDSGCTRRINITFASADDIGCRL